MRELLPHLAELDERHDSMLSLVERLANLNSGSFHLAGIARVAEILEAEFACLGGESTRVKGGSMVTVDDCGNELRQDLGPMIHIRKRPDAKRSVLLCIHMDTVFDQDSPFQTCRKLPNGTVNGPGVADAKGGLVVMLEALKILESSPWADQLGWEVLINSDEEVGSYGSVGLMQEIAQRCDFGLLFEPAIDEKHLVSWRKGSGSFAFLVRGRAAHAGRHFQDGRNAVVAACQLGAAIDELNQDPDVTYNVGKIAGGDALNVVPDLAIVRVNVRVVSVDQQKQVEAKLSELATMFGKKDGIQVEVSGGFASPPKPMTPEIEALQRQIEASAEALGQSIAWMGTGGTCDGNKFAAAGLPNVDSLGPIGGRIHSDEEFLVPESLVPKAKLAALVLLGYARNGELKSA